MSTLTKEREAEIRQREANASAGPWFNDTGYGIGKDNQRRLAFILLTRGEQVAEKELKSHIIASFEGATEQAQHNAAFLAKARQDIPDLLAELDRIRPQWVPVSEGSHEYNHLYQVAGIPTEGKPPRHVGRGRYIEAAGMWFDEDTNRPFTYPITHYGRQLAITEIIGQPTLD